ncbi:hypothetical protein ACN28S_58805 [Cystobacter fuscus]
MTSRSSLLALPLALGLLAGCTSNPHPPVESRPAESGGTPAASAEATPPPPPSPRTPRRARTSRVAPPPATASPSSTS